ncbi:MAG: ECF-type sigma factor [Planctomycetota bacterium]|nr:ECF-type sigma factor [Planctomycetota bacterium]
MPQPEGLASPASEGDVRLSGDAKPASADQLIHVAYRELRNLAEQRLRSLAPGASLQPTELLNEVYLRLGHDRSRVWNGRAHFVGAAALAMRHVLVDRARRAATIKRGGERGRVAMEGLEIPEGRTPNEILGVDRALEALEKVDSRSAQVVMMRFYLGLSNSEIALSLGVTERTVERDWAFARRWLASQLASDPELGAVVGDVPAARPGSEPPQRT